MKLDSLLSDATALQYITCVLASLKVKEVDERNIDAMLAAFNAVDVKHLLSLDVQNMSSMITLLAANTDNTKTVLFNETPGERMKIRDILRGNTSLRSIEVVEPNVDIVHTLNVFGNLSYLTALKTISLHFEDGFDDVPLGTGEWSELDRWLAQVGDSLKVVNIYALAELADVKAWLPAVARKISVHVDNQELDMSYVGRRLTERMATMIKKYGSHARSSLKDGVRPLIGPTYKFKVGDSDKIIATIVELTRIMMILPLGLCAVPMTDRAVVSTGGRWAVTVPSRRFEKSLRGGTGDGTAVTANGTVSTNV
ncbi:hypothetical protein C8J57DRAFT_1493988 [Mycena rebaudengoi]|nr:hypothetical protein C8J57DRAFT_1493988 [Mycena rebaudengoi]